MQMSKDVYDLPSRCLHMALAQDADEMSTWISARLDGLRTHQDVHITRYAKELLSGPTPPYSTLTLVSRAPRFPPLPHLSSSHARYPLPPLP